VHKRVGTWTFDLLQRIEMKHSSDGTSGCGWRWISLLIGVAGGDGGRLVAGAASHLMTSTARSAM